MFFDDAKGPGANETASTRASHHSSDDASRFSEDSSAESVGQVKTLDRLEQVAEFIEQASPRPNYEIAMVGAIGILSGILGRCYNTYTGAGLNQYILMLAKSGLGKDAIDSGQAKLLNSVCQLALNFKDGVVSNSSTFRGPEIVSAPGQIKWTEKHPSYASIAGEFGYFLQRVGSSRPNPNDLGIQQLWLKLYSKSGAGNSYDPLAYSDRDKQTKPIQSPAFTLIAESVPEPVYEAFNERMASNGFLSRFMVQEIVAERAALNENPASAPNEELRQWFADLCAYSLQLNYNNQAIRVPTDAEGGALLRQFDQWCDAEIRAHNSEGIRELWNRAHLKALKLATLRAVVNSHLDPVVTLLEARWATDLIAKQTNALIAKFEAGEVGNTIGDITAQENAMIKVIADYIRNPWKESYHGKREMHKDYCIAKGYIQQRCNNIKAFYAHGAMRKKAIDDTLYSLVEGDYLAAIDASQMWARYKTRARGFIISNPDFFLKKIGAL